ncbi:hypothetical protein SDC9_116643 [bioreactor metagenome]|uniref:Uncharacterized protein n=1 Tax=bioreactor metagenome TaxID=1076179 RepID=A0A645BWS0_9ZZZZ
MTDDALGEAGNHSGQLKGRRCSRDPGGVEHRTTAGVDADIVHVDRRGRAGDLRSGALDDNLRHRLVDLEGVGGVDRRLGTPVTGHIDTAQIGQHGGIDRRRSTRRRARGRVGRRRARAVVGIAATTGCEGQYQSQGSGDRTQARRPAFGRLESMVMHQCRLPDLPDNQLIPGGQ